MKIRKKVKMQNKSIRSRDLEDDLDDFQERAEDMLWAHKNVHLCYSNRWKLSIKMLVEDEFVSSQECT
jgi:hypothetical protein